MTTSSSSSSSSSSSENSYPGTLELLIAVNEAIKAILSGVQEYRIGDRMVRRADLGELMRTRTRLQREYAAESGNRPYVSAGDFRGNF